MLRFIVAIIATFLYVYPINFQFLPLINSRYLIALLGMVCYFFDSRKSKVPNNLITPFLCVVALTVFATISTKINGANDFAISFLPFTFILTFFAFSGLDRLYGCLTLEKFTFLLSIAALIQITISVTSFIIPELRDLIDSVVSFSAIEEAGNERAEGVRIRGLGTSYYTSGVIHSVLLLMISIFSSKRKIFYTLAYLIIAIGGICMSRTLMIGIAFSLIILIKNLGGSKWYKVIPLFLVVIFLAIFVYNYTIDSDNIFVSTIFGFGFQFFSEYLESGSVETHSITSLEESIRFPSTLSGWLIGDGYWKDPLDPEYQTYMHVDQGYLRALFYYGIIGLFFHLMIYWKMVCSAVHYSKNKYFYVIFLVYLVIFLKGYQNIFEFLIPILFLLYRENKLERKCCV